MLGGSSGMHHLIHYQGTKSDYIPWAAAANDSSWNYTTLHKYAIRSEKMEDLAILKSNYSVYHGKSGNMRLTREPSDSNIDILKAFNQLGYPTRVDVSGPNSLGISEPILYIADGDRQSSAEGYLGTIKSRTNLKVLTHATVTEILFDSNNVATGVKYVDSTGETYSVCANKEVILAAGAIGSPYILQHSGIGPEAVLEAAGITVRENLPVGENLQEHTLAAMPFTLGASNATAPPTNPHMFPAPMTTAYIDYDGDEAPDVQIINLVFPPLSTGFLQVCLFVFKYLEEVCQKIFAASSNKNLLLSVPNIVHPKSRGRVYLDPTAPSGPPVIELGVYTNSTDLTNMGLYLKEFAEILNTPVFESLGAEFIDMGFCNETTYGTTEYWECHAVTMSASMIHECGTCSIGSVVNNRLQVYGTTGLRVVDASIMPTLTSGNSNGGVIWAAEKASDMIKEDWGITIS